MSVNCIYARDEGSNLGQIGTPPPPLGSPVVAKLVQYCFIRD